MEPFPGVRTRLLVEEVSTNESTRRSTRTVSVPIGSSYEPIGSVMLSSVSDFGFEAMASSWPAFLLAAAGSMSLALILGLVLGGRLSKPITSLNQVAGKMGAGELSARASTQEKDEIGELAAQFNHMAAQLETSFSQLAAERDALRRFIADASHELRTPITALQNFNELLMDAAADDPLARAEFLAESKLQIERLVWITQNLLDLSRLEAGLASLELSKSDADELIAHLKTLFEARAMENAIQLTINPPENPIELYCDRGRLEMALSNLLDNALKFTSQGGEVTASVERMEGVVRFWVKDNGAGIHPDDLPHIFERFYRGRNSDQPGSGLGLSIVQSVAQAHGGRVWVESQLSKGSKFSIEIPGGIEPGSSDYTFA